VDLTIGPDLDRWDKTPRLHGIPELLDRIKHRKAPTFGQGNQPHS
jgi:hypothetical protein